MRIDADAGEGKLGHIRAADQDGADSLKSGCSAYNVCTNRASDTVGRASLVAVIQFVQGGIDA